MATVGVKGLNLQLDKFHPRYCRAQVKKYHLGRSRERPDRQ